MQGPQNRERKEQCHTKSFVCHLAVSSPHALPDHDLVGILLKNKARVVTRACVDKSLNETRTTVTWKLTTYTVHCYVARFHATILGGHALEHKQTTCCVLCKGIAAFAACCNACCIVTYISPLFLANKVLCIVVVVVALGDILKSCFGDTKGLGRQRPRF